MNVANVTQHLTCIISVVAVSAFCFAAFSLLFSFALAHGKFIHKITQHTHTMIRARAGIQVSAAKQLISIELRTDICAMFGVFATSPRLQLCHVTQ